MKPNGGFGVRMALPSLARLVSLDTCLTENTHSSFDTRIKARHMRERYRILTA